MGIGTCLRRGVVKSGSKIAACRNLITQMPKLRPHAGKIIKPLAAMTDARIRIALRRLCIRACDADLASCGGLASCVARKKPISGNERNQKYDIIW